MVYSSKTQLEPINEAAWHSSSPLHSSQEDALSHLYEELSIRNQLGQGVNGHAGSIKAPASQTQFNERSEVRHATSLPASWSTM
jgi:hypothetical protein